MLTIERLCELLNYDQETGVFTWRVKPRSNHVMAGDIAGSVNRIGYREISIDGRLYYAHRMAWLYVTGCWPTDEIDHCNGTKDDNKFANLRDTTRSGNMQNLRRANRNNKARMLGVSRNCKKFKAEIQIKMKRHYLGAFSTPEAAHAAYIEAKRRLHPEGML